MDLAINHHTAAVLESVVGDLGERLDRLVAIQITTYPDHWTSEEKRECAERVLFAPVAAGQRARAA